jgi:hypothetical protein
MFRSLFYDHPQGLSFVLSAFTTFPLLGSSFVFSVCGRMPSMCMCVRCSCLWVVWTWFTTRQPTDRYTGQDTHTHIHIDNIQPHIGKANDEANKRRSGNAISTKDDS